MTLQETADKIYELLNKEYAADSFAVGIGENIVFIYTYKKFKPEFDKSWIPPEFTVKIQHVGIPQAKPAKPSKRK